MQVVPLDFYSNWFVSERKGMSGHLIFEFKWI